MKIIDEILQQIEYCITNNDYARLENEKIELKDNSHNTSEWNEVFKTSNALLNTNGGIIVIGIFEDQKKNSLFLKDSILIMKTR